MPGVARGDDGRLYEPLRWSHRIHAGVRSGLPRGSEPAQFPRRTAGALSKACTLSASRSASTRVKINACRSLCALISRRKSWSYAEEVTVSGKPSGRGAGTATNGCRSPSSWRQVGQSPHQGCSQPWQLAPSSRSPAAAAQSSKPTGRVWRAASSAATRARQSVDSHARRLKSAGHAVPIASSWIGDGADRVIEEGLPSRAVVLPGSAAATDHDHRLRLGRDGELLGVEVLGLALLGDE